MSKFFVAVRNERPLQRLLMTLNRDQINPPVIPFGEPGDNDYVLIRCTSVETTVYGFLRLAPDLSTPAASLEAVTIPASLVAWIAEAPDSSNTSLGFL